MPNYQIDQDGSITGVPGTKYYVDASGQAHLASSQRRKRKVVVISEKGLKATVHLISLGARMAHRGGRGGSSGGLFRRHRRSY